MAVHGDQVLDQRTSAAAVVGTDAVDAVRAAVGQQQDRNRRRDRRQVHVGQAACEHDQPVHLAGDREGEVTSGCSPGRGDEYGVAGGGGGPFVTADHLFDV